MESPASDVLAGLRLLLGSLVTGGDPATFDHDLHRLLQPEGRKVTNIDVRPSTAPSVPTEKSAGA
jgi:hypothetical protein